jgi:hypothetical protein
MFYVAAGSSVFRGTGAHRIATFLREHDWDVEVCDFTVSWPIECLKEYVKSRVTSETVFFGFSTFFNFWTPQMSEFTLWLKQTYPNIKIVLGGQSVARTPAENIDYWVDSFGEYAILELVKSFIGNSGGIKFDFEHMGSKKLIKSISAYPAYPMASYKVLMEKRDFLESYEWLTTEFSRGCRFKCNFCNFPILGVKDDHSRTQEDFIDNMNYNYDNFGIKHYYVADETFNDSREKIKKFADAAEQISFRPFFSGFMRADLMLTQPEQLEHLVRLNFGGHYYGIETMNHKSAKMVGKGMHPDKIKQGLLDVRKYMMSKIPYRGTISLIWGLPFETKATLLETEQWLLKNWTDQGLVIFPLSVEDAEGENLKNQTNVSDFGKNMVKYGLRKMSKGTYDGPTDEWDYRWRQGNYAADEMLWEHDTMNIFDAYESAFQIQNDSLTKFRLDNWSMGNPSFNSGTDMGVSNELISSTKMSGIIQKHAIQRFVESYIRQKLNWKPEK